VRALALRYADGEGRRITVPDERTCLVKNRAGSRKPGNHGIPHAVVSGSPREDGPPRHTAGGRLAGPVAFPFRPPASPAGEGRRP